MNRDLEVDPRRRDLEIEQLRLRLAEAEQTLEAIRSGAVDSVVVEGPDGLRVYALEGAANTYRVLIEAMSEGAASLSEEGLVLYCNNCLARILELPLEQVMGSSLIDRVPAQHREAFRSMIELSQTEECRGELALLSTRGEEVPVYFSLNTIESEGRRVVCAVAVDLRPKLRNEERLALERNRRMAAESSSHFAQLFMGVLGHDLRSPLSAIVTGAQMLSGKAKDEVSARVAARMVSSGERMARMIEQLLDVTRIGLGGGLLLAKREAAFSDICQGVIDEFVLASDSRRIVARYDGDTSGFWDADRFAQVVSNLLGNAIRHGAPGVAVSLVVEGRGPAVVARIHNKGVIDAAVLPHLFQPFKRREAPTSASSGLGLGLYITDQIVRAHGGRIEVRSTEEDGTTFVVTLPREDGGFG